jgi:hypothetical protein
MVVGTGFGRRLTDDVTDRRGRCPCWASRPRSDLLELVERVALMLRDEPDATANAVRRHISPSSVKVNET